MRQSLNHKIPSHTNAALRASLRRAVARDLHMPEHYAVVIATLSALSALTRLQTDSIPQAVATTLDAGWCSVGHVPALTAK